MVIEKGKIIHSPLFTLRYLGDQPAVRFAAIMPKKIAKTAVARNTARRRVYAAIGEVLAKAASTKSGGKGRRGAHAVFVCKANIPISDMATMVSDIEALLKKVSVL